MANPSKAKGSTHERDVCRYLNAHGFPHAERMPAGATLDRGDLAAVVDRDGDRWTVEVKRWREQGPAAVRGWCREAATEAENGGTAFWLVVGKRWGSADAGDSPVWLPLKALVELGAGPQVRLAQWDGALVDDVDADPVLDRSVQITLRAWCALAGDGS